MPKICCINFHDHDIELIRRRYPDIYCGSLGTVSMITYENAVHTITFLPSHDFPQNLHEYDVLLIDLGNKPEKKLLSSQRIKITKDGRSRPVIVCRYPQNCFDPRPMNASLLYETLKKTDKKMFIIVFSSKDYKQNYRIADDISDLNKTNEYQYRLHDFLPRIGNIDRSGQVINHSADYEQTELRRLLDKYIKEFSYDNAFLLPPRNSGADVGCLQQNGFYSLLESSVGETVSYAAVYHDKKFLILPQIENKGELVLDLLDNVLPAWEPDLFPESALNAWLRNEHYMLPGHESLRNKLTALTVEYENEKALVEDEINENNLRNLWLHDLVTKDGDTLKLAVIKMLEYLEFSSVVDMDRIGCLDEDIQIIEPESLIICETKGLSGTSKDNDIQQVIKHLYTRIKQNNGKHVSALYIVNHQKHIEPLKRSFNPFTESQLTNFSGFDLGLITTWQLFLVYRYINDEKVFTKADIRRQIGGVGFIALKPLELYDQYTAEAVHMSKSVASISLSGQTISIGDDIVMFDDHFIMNRGSIASIQQAKNELTYATSGKVGITSTNGITFTEGQVIYIRNRDAVIDEP